MRRITLCIFVHPPFTSSLMGPHIKHPSIYKYLLRNRKNISTYYKFYSLWKFLHIYLYKSVPVTLCSFLKMHGANYNDKMAITFLTAGFISKVTEWIGIRCYSHGLGELLIFRFNVFIFRSCGAPNSHKTQAKYYNFSKKNSYL
jgi:hypothetical protein